MEYWTQNEKNIFVAAHRGWSAKYPENTMESFRAAMTEAVDQLETDVRITKDGELVLIHDAAVDRTTDKTGLVRDFTLAELRALDASNGMEAFHGAKIPTLEEFLDFARAYPALTLDIELKEYPVTGWEKTAWDVCDRTLELLEKYGFAGRFVLNTFSAGLHEYVAARYGSAVKRHVYYPAARFKDYESEAPYLGAYCCCMFDPARERAMATPAEFAAMRARGVRTWAGAGVKTAAGVDEAIACGAELITCNDPADVLGWLRERGYHA